MAKQQMPVMPKAGGGLLGKLVGTLVVLALLVLVVKHPAAAATMVQGLFGLLGGAVEGLVAFFTLLGQQ
ncbi:hypothetical protein [Saccharopolyspora mangrovi]|uniref:Secreted protein n=1 Tax=Saccharopolyspora mangrovi TaxID=3082379 RepID=A0ABU6A9A5_9PSEU|nr:hypothetical protein [Saccharopolyspora sp. S2-29]MEB3368071.1 hypothetical protein [Saccharopolyspora sp. S2-29]